MTPGMLTLFLMLCHLLTYSHQAPERGSHDTIWPRVRTRGRHKDYPEENFQHGGQSKDGHHQKSSHLSTRTHDLWGRVRSSAAGRREIVLSGKSMWSSSGQSDHTRHRHNNPSSEGVTDDRQEKVGKSRDQTWRPPLADPPSLTVNIPPTSFDVGYSDQKYLTSTPAGSYRPKSPVVVGSDRPHSDSSVVSPTSSVRGHGYLHTYSGQDVQPLPTSHPHPHPHDLSMRSRARHHPSTSVNLQKSLVLTSDKNIHQSNSIHNRDVMTKDGPRSKKRRRRRRKRRRLKDRLKSKKRKQSREEDDDKNRHRKRFSGDEFDDNNQTRRGGNMVDTGMSADDLVIPDEERQRAINNDIEGFGTQEDDHPTTTVETAEDLTTNSGSEDDIAHKMSTAETDGQTQHQNNNIISNNDDNDDNKEYTVFTPPPAFGLFATVQELVETVKLLYDQQQHDRQKLKALERRCRSLTSQIQTGHVTLAERINKTEASIQDFDLTYTEVKDELKTVTHRQAEIARTVNGIKRERRKIAQNFDKKLENCSNQHQIIQDLHRSEMDKISNKFRNSSNEIRTIKDDVTNVRKLVEEARADLGERKEKEGMIDEEIHHITSLVQNSSQTLSRLGSIVEGYGEDLRGLQTEVEDLHLAYVMTSDPEFQQQLVQSRDDEIKGHNSDTGRVRTLRHLTKPASSRGYSSDQSEPADQGNVSETEQDSENEEENPPTNPTYFVHGDVTTGHVTEVKFVGKRDDVKEIDQSLVDKEEGTSSHGSQAIKEPGVNNSIGNDFIQDGQNQENSNFPAILSSTTVADQDSNSVWEDVSVDWSMSSGDVTSEPMKTTSPSVTNHPELRKSYSEIVSSIYTVMDEHQDQQFSHFTPELKASVSNTDIKVLTPTPDFERHSFTHELKFNSLDPERTLSSISNLLSSGDIQITSHPASHTVIDESSLPSTLPLSEIMLSEAAATSSSSISSSPSPSSITSTPELTVKGPYLTASGSIETTSDLLTTAEQDFVLHSTLSVDQNKLSQPPTSLAEPHASMAEPHMDIDTPTQTLSNVDSLVTASTYTTTHDVSYSASDISSSSLNSSPTPPLKPPSTHSINSSPTYILDSSNTLEPNSSSAQNDILNSSPTPQFSSILTPQISSLSTNTLKSSFTPPITSLPTFTFSSTPTLASRYSHTLALRSPIVSFNLQSHTPSSSHITMLSSTPSSHAMLSSIHGWTTSDTMHAAVSPSLVSSSEFSDSRVLDLEDGMSSQGYPEDSLTSQGHLQNNKDNQTTGGSDLSEAEMEENRNCTSSINSQTENVPYIKQLEARIESLEVLVNNATAELRQKLDRQTADTEEKTFIFEDRLRQTDEDIEQLMTAAAKTSALVMRLGSQVAAINIEEFIHELQESLSNFTKNVLTRDQWNIASQQIAETTIEIQNQLASLAKDFEDNTHSVSKLHERVSHLQSVGQRRYRSLQGHVIRLNNTLQDLVEKVEYLESGGKDQSSTYELSAQATTQAQVDSLHIQLLYNANRLSRLETDLLNKSLTNCEHSTAQLQQASKLLRLDKEQEETGKELRLVQEKLKRTELNVFRFHSAIKQTEQSLAGLESDVTQLQPIRAQLKNIQLEVDNMVFHVPQDCHEYYLRGFHESGVYVIHPMPLNRTIRVYCIMEGQGLAGAHCGGCGGCSRNCDNNNNNDYDDDDDDDNNENKINNSETIERTQRQRDKNLGQEWTGGWTVIQRRMTGKVNFTRPWADYKDGFGQADNEHWLGNDIIHLLTNQKEYELRVVMEDVFSGYWEARYDKFKVAGQGDNYRLEVGSYHGNASDGLSYSNKMGFSTRDRDNDASTSHCAMYNGGGWWYSHCQVSNLNGPFHVGIVWYNRAWHDWLHMNSSTMSIRPRHREN